MTERLYFGTDGMRGKAGSAPITPELVLKLGMAAGQFFLRGEHRHRVIIAKDTRLSGYMIEPALTAGFISVGMDVVLVGPMPTPAVAMLTRSLRADLGVMISASHNPYYDNGIKLFSPDGTKLSDETELAIEALMQQPPVFAEPAAFGRAKRLDDARGRYMEFVKNTFPKQLSLDGLKIVIDCAHGAAYNIAPAVLYELGAEIIPLGVAPDGFNINRDCGSTHPALIQEAVVREKADIGIALDGDADRLALCDEHGKLVDGDQILAMIATYWHKKGLMRGRGIVATDMSNLGLERYLGTVGLNLHRTRIGDRYVAEAMRSHGYNIGGEQSGHVIFSDYSTTGDGLIAALQVLAVMREEKRPLSEVSNRFTPMPQILRNIRIKSGAKVLENAKVKQSIADAESELSDTGRILVRKSGTEPLIRVMLEGEELSRLNRLADHIAAAIDTAA